MEFKANSKDKAAITVGLLRDTLVARLIALPVKELNGSTAKGYTCEGERFYYGRDIIDWLSLMAGDDAAEKMKVSLAWIEAPNTGRELLLQIKSFVDPSESKKP